MKKLTLESLDGLMSVPLLRKIDNDYPFFPLSSYLNSIRKKVWFCSEYVNNKSLQNTFEEKYIFNLIAILNSKTTPSCNITCVAANELRAVMEIIVERVFMDHNEHNSYLLSIIDNVKHPKLEETILIK